MQGIMAIIVIALGVVAGHWLVAFMKTKGWMAG